MKTEIKEILDYMEGGEEILRLLEGICSMIPSSIRSRLTLKRKFSANLHHIWPDSLAHQNDGWQRNAC